MKSAIPRTGAWCAGLALAAAVAVPVAAQGQANYARSLAANCFACHGTDGRSVGGIPPSIAGQNKDYMLQVMKDYKAGKRPATVMHQQAKGYTDEQLELIAGYFAGMRPGSADPAPSARGGN
jgi:cytochrome subunit of sulfide dehydrogenase